MPEAARQRIGVVEDDPHLREQMVVFLAAHYDVLQADNPESAWALLEEHRPDLMLVDLHLPPSGTAREGLQLLRRIRGAGGDTLVVVMSGAREKEPALKAIDEGAYDYFTKPVDLKVLQLIISRALERQRIERENRLLRDEIERRETVGDLLGSTEAIRSVFQAVRKIAPSDSSVIVRGESGTGKELVARALHELSPRREAGFVSVNCGALPEGLMEAELFGYEKGAFTGAAAMKEGRFELAHRGTLFLDEIGTLTLPLQAKLLRVLEERAVAHLGGKKSIKVDFRLVTATNEDLEARVKAGSFREDLYYRINVVPVAIPPLRQRRGDIALLLDHFLKIYCAANRVPPKRVETAALEAIERYDWPGNVRELENVTQRLVLMTEGPTIMLKHLPEHVRQAAPGPGADHFRIPAQLEEELLAYEKSYLQQALARAGGSKVEAARLLGLSRDKMKHLCRKHGL